MIDETFVYHRVLDQLFGTILRPLNEWKELDPQLYTAKAAKYDNRKSVMEQQIDPLGCVWNDVLFCNRLIFERSKRLLFLWVIG